MWIAPWVAGPILETFGFHGDRAGRSLWEQCRTLQHTALYPHPRRALVDLRLSALITSAPTAGSSTCWVYLACLTAFLSPCSKTDRPRRSSFRWDGEKGAVAEGHSSSIVVEEAVTIHTWSCSDHAFGLAFHVLRVGGPRVFYAWVSCAD